MAIYHFSAQAIGRGKGRSAVAAAAYRSGTRLDDARTGLTHDYRAKGGVAHSEIIMPPTAGDWRPSRQELWNAAEKANGRADAVIAREFDIALPHELSADQRKELARDFARYVAQKFNVAVDFAIHEPGAEGDHRNHHMHMMVTAKRVKGEGFGTKATELDPFSAAYRGVNKGQANAVDMLREVWAALANNALEAAGSDARIDHRDLKSQGKDQEATVHLGPSASAMERRGEATDRGDQNREAKAGNARRDALKEEIRVIGHEIRDEAQARAERQAERELAASARTFDAGKILEALTERRSTFSRADLGRVLKAEVENPAERAEVVNAILSRPDVIGLREDTGKPVSRYTTRQVLADEMQIMEAARSLDGVTRHGLTDWQKAEALDRHSQLDLEQREAFDRATGAGAFSMIAGEAGTGKSTTMGAIRDAYEAAGYRVIGLAWTNAVVQDMQADGFSNAATIASELMRLANGSSQWNARTVLMVDEAAMLSTKHLSAFMAQAKATGAKVILAGDDAQLTSIERGGVFGALRQEHGAAELHSVRRVSDAEQRRAFNLMHDGNFRPALDIFDRMGAIHWGQTDAEARADLVAKYAADMKAEPGKSRFVFANSNAEVMALNREIRALKRERGELGDDHYLRGADGREAFAKGDRIIFTASAIDRRSRDAGFINGQVGTIQGIDGQRVTVALDSKGQKQRVVSFNVGDNAEAGEFKSFRHGYAGTIYKGQGRTLDQTYVLHSASMGAASSYVGLSRHRERVAIFTTRGADAWVMATGGLDKLTEAQRRSAERSYARWKDAKPELAARHGLADYVGYVQEQQAKRGPDHAADLDRLARQMGRVDDRRSASQFKADPESVSRAAGAAQGPREGFAEARDTAGGQEPPTARQSAAAHRVGARVAAMRNPFRQAEALHRAHVRDAERARLAQLAAKRAEDQRTADMAARQAEARRQSQIERDQMARDRMTKGQAPSPAPAVKAAAAEIDGSAARQAEARRQSQIEREQMARDAAARQATEEPKSRAERAQEAANREAREDAAHSRERRRERGRTR